MDVSVECVICHQSVKLSQYVNHISSKHAAGMHFDICCPAPICAGEKKYTTIAGLKTHWRRNHARKFSAFQLHQQLQSTPALQEKMETEEPSNDEQAHGSDFDPAASNSFMDSIEVGNEIDCDDRDICDDLSCIKNDWTSDVDVLEEIMIDEPESNPESELLPEHPDSEDVFEDCEEVDQGDNDEDGESHTSSSSYGYCQSQKEELPPLLFEASKFVLKVKTTFGVTEEALVEILTEATTLLNCVLVSFANQVYETFEKSGKLSPVQLRKEAVGASQLLTDFLNKSKRNTCLSKLFPKIPVSKRIVGVYGKRQGAGEKRKTVIMQDKVMYVPLSKSLHALTRHQDFATLLQSQSVSPDANLIDSFLKSECFVKNEYLASHPNALRIILYFDELEICNVLGAMAGKHKLGCVYYVLDNIPLKYRSNLNIIQLAAIFNSNFIKRHVNGMDAVLKPAVEDLKRLESGIKLTDGSELKAVLIAVIGDNLGSHQVGGFKEGFTASHPCRTCLVSYESLQSMVKEDSSILRTKQNYEEQVAQVKKHGDAKSVEFGINRNPILNSLKYYHVIDGLPPDGHHDILQGVLQLTLKKLLSSLVQKKIITLQTLNDSLLNGFNYGFSYTKPAEIKSDHLLPDGNLRQSAIQMWYLAILLPLVIGKDVPEDLPEWENFISLLEICRIVFSPSISVGMLDHLVSLIDLYLTSFIDCYGCALIPKQHHLLHYPRLIRKFGPPVYFWAMRMEAKHKFFKKMVSVLGNYKNPPWTLANIHEWRMALFRSGSLIKSNKCGPLKSYPVHVLPYAHLVIGAETIKLTKWIRYEGILFKSDGLCYVALDTDDRFYPNFALVQDLIVWPEFRIVCKRVVVHAYNTHLSSFEVEVLDEFMIIQSINIQGHTVFHSHPINGKQFIPMRYSIKGSL